jgi:folate-binding protein YgfZ
MASTLADLNNFDLIAVNGVEATSFLQGQLSCNLSTLSTEHTLLGTYCDLKGRVISDMRVLMYGQDILLLCQSGMGIALRKTLDKYIVFSKAKTALKTDQFERYGIFGAEAANTVIDLFGAAPQSAGEALVVGEAIVYRLPDAQARFEVLVAKDNEALVERIQSLDVTDDLEEWDLADIRQGIVHIHPDIQASYTPQLLNYDLTGHIDFKKGCYTGQEIVARMHYRGTAKKRLYHASIEGLTANLGSSVLHQGESVGEIISVALVDTGHFEMLLILPCELVDKKATFELRNGNLESGEKQSAATALTLLTLPILENL